jgi:hypothetical protein
MIQKFSYFDILKENLSLESKILYVVDICCNLLVEGYLRLAIALYQALDNGYINQARRAIAHYLFNNQMVN